MHYRTTLRLALGTALFAGAATAAPLSIVPPPDLTLDGMSIFAGNFTLTGATSYTDPGAVISTQTLLDQGNAGDDVVINATIGDTAPNFLVNVPDETEVLELQGFFDATSPDLNPAQFRILVGVTQDLSLDAFVYYLPTTTTDSYIQVTDLGPNQADFNDNVSYFFGASVDLLISLDVADPAFGGLSPIVLNNGLDNSWFVGERIPPGPVPPITGNPGNAAFLTSCTMPMSTVVQRHGTSTTTTVFVPCETVAVPSSLWLLAFGIPALIRRRKT